MQSDPEDTRQGAVRREWPSPAVLRLWARAKAIPSEACLAFNRFPARCIRHYYLDRVLAACVNSEAEACVVQESLMPQSGLVMEDTRRSIT